MSTSVSVRVALVGNPNVGKTTLFNQLTGLRQRVANFPGVTVERKAGTLTGAPHVEVIDLPGTYSLTPKSLDEQITYEVLVGKRESSPDLVVCVADAGNLERNLYVASQVIDLGFPVVLALNMIDAAEENGLTVDAPALEKELGAPVIPVVASRGKGIEELKQQILVPPRPAQSYRWKLMDAVEAKIPDLSKQLHEEVPQVRSEHIRMEVLCALAEDKALDAWSTQAPEFVGRIKNLREEFAERGIAWRHAEVSGRYAWLGPIVSKSVQRVQEPATFSDRIDAVLTHQIFGPLIFLAILVGIFQAVFSWATPAMDLIETGVAALTGLVQSALPPGWATDLLADGVITGVGNVVIFFPQILLLFFFLGLMEDTGYMARSAFIMDRVMKRAGLSGGSVLPLLSSYACAIPGIMAARTLDSERDRLITIMIAPLMSCSARLPVYTLFIAAFIPAGTFMGVFGYQGLTMFSMYLMGTAMAFVAAAVLKRLVFKGGEGYFVMELPPYRRPQLRQVLWRMIQRSKVFAVRAGKIIFACSVILWFLASYPRADTDMETVQAEMQAAQQREAGFAEAQALLSVPGMDMSALADSTLGADSELMEAQQIVRQAEYTYAAAMDSIAILQQSAQIRGSAVGYLGRILEPVMQPLGFDWKISAGLVSAFAAREVIISTLSIIYSVEDAEEGVALRDALKADRYPDGRPVFTPLVAVSLLVFFVFALQCMSTLAIARRETNTWRWPVVMWLYMTGLAYLAALFVYQGGLLLGFS